MRFTSALGGEAADGLTVPESLPVIAPKTLSELDFAERCEAVLRAFFGEVTGVRDAVRRDYDEEQVPIVKLDDDLYALELWHGKTCYARDLIKTVGTVLNPDGEVDNTAMYSVAAQVAYWFSAYCDLADSGEIEYGDKIDVALPIECDGGLVAAWYAKEMGLPICKIVCADGKSRALCDFIDTGTFAVGAEADADLRIVPELERIMFSIDNKADIAARMRELKDAGMFSVSDAEAIRFRGAVACEYVESEAADEAIEYAFDEYGYLIDPATALAFAAESERDRVRVTLVAAVAHPYTSPKEVLYALGENPKGTYEDMLNALEELSAVEIPDALKKD